MKSILRQQLLSSLLAALATIFLGAVLLVWPNRSVRVICSLLGAILFLLGLFYVIGCISKGRHKLPSAFLFLPGVILIGLGAFLMMRPDSVVALIQYVFGLLIIFHGILDLQSALALIGARVRRWWLELALAAVTLGLGALILINPFGTFAALVMLIGCVLIYDGISDLWILYRVSRNLASYEEKVIETEGRDPDE